ncbi:MAG TPA: ATP-dependent helicase, partial [Flavobacteriales bacterium]|nr:ATP-dependent helicase [Flavobacteriales bacterium]
MIKKGAKILLFEILNRYSVGELVDLIGKDIVAGYEKLVDKSIAKADLARAVDILHGFQIVSQKELREKFIDRMSPDQVTSCINGFLIDAADSVNPPEGIDNYNALNQMAIKWPDKFIEILGFKDVLELNSLLEDGIRGITTVEAEYPMYPYQQRMVKKVNALFRSIGKNRCLLHLPTGAGKTRTAMNIAAEHLRENEDGLVLWLADTSELCSQAGMEFSKAWSSLGNRSVKLYSYYSDTNISLGGIDNGFLVAGLQKLNSASGSNDYSVLYEQLRKHVTLIIFDEAHRAIAPTYARIVKDMINVNEETLFLGLSATPGRKLEFNSDEDEELTQFFCGNKVTLKIPGFESPIKYLVEQDYLAKAHFINIDYDGNKILLDDAFANQKRTDEIRQALSEDEARNIKLLEVISEEHSKGSSIIVFACSVEHSRAIASMLAFKGIKAFSLDSKYDDSESRRYKIAGYSQGKVRVLVNFNILTAGFDAPITNVAIIARPTDSLVQFSQMAGRAMRGKRSGGNLDCQIYTVRDDIPAFTSVAQAFSHWDK